MKLADKYKKTSAQILLNFINSRGLVCIPKSTNPDRIKENIGIFDFDLEEKEKELLFSLNEDHRFVNPGSWWGFDYFA